MANKQVTLRNKVVLNLKPGEKEKYGLGKDDSHIVTLPAGLVNIPEELTKHWFVSASIEAGKRPLMGGSGIDHKPVDPNAPNPTQDKDTDGIKSDEELETMSDEDLRQYLRDAGNQTVSATAPRDNVLARIEKLRPKAD